MGARESCRRAKSRALRTLSRRARAATRWVLLPSWGLLVTAIAIGQVPAPLEVRVPPEWQQLGAERSQPGVAWTWRGILDGVRCDLALRIAPESPERTFAEPESVIEVLRNTLRRPTGWICSRRPLEPTSPELADGLLEGSEHLQLGRAESWCGHFGWAQIAGHARGVLRQDDQVVGSLRVVAGLLPDGGYLLTATCRPAAPPALEARLDDVLRAMVRWRGAVRDPSWTAAEVRRRWAREIPAALPLRDVARSEHYVVLSTARIDGDVLRELERGHERLREIVPFADLTPRRLLPVFLFASQDEYHSFAATQGVLGTRGHSLADACATTVADREVLRHELVHQLMHNRVFLGGGGGWLQEGLAEYVSGDPARRTELAARVVRGATMDLWSLIRAWEVPTGAAVEHETLDDEYELAALAVAFFHDSAWAGDRFPQLVERVGLMAPGDGAAVEDAIADVYGVPFEAVEEAWLQWCATQAGG